MQKSAAEIMKEQEALLMAKYGGAGGKFPMGKKKPGAPKVSRDVAFIKRPCNDSISNHHIQAETKYFDSADWAMKKEAQSKPDAPPPPPEPEVALKPKLEPTPSMQRRISHMDSLGPGH